MSPRGDLDAALAQLKALGVGASPGERREAVAAYVRAKSGETAGRPSNDLVDPSTGESLGRVATTPGSRIVTAVKDLQAAQADWEARGIGGRAEVLSSLATGLHDWQEAIAVCDSVNAGLPLTTARGEIKGAIDSIGLWAGLAHALAGRTHLGREQRLDMTVRRPYGVVARFVASNHPASATFAAIMPVLLAGNTALIKPSDQTPISAMLIGDLLADLLPEHLVEIAPGGPSTAEAILDEPRIGRISFTGGTPVGLKVQARANEGRLRDVTLELTGKNAMYVLPDADPGAAAAGLVAGVGFRSTRGQSCTSSANVYLGLPDPEAFIEDVAAEIEGLEPGIAYADDTTFGPMVSSGHAERVREVAAEARRASRREVAPTWAGELNGAFVAPSLFDEPARETSLWREEHFGPLVGIRRTADFEAAIRENNAAGFGLAASFWGASESQLLGLAGRAEAGYVWVNCAGEFPWGLPFTGWNDSGRGSQQSLEEIESFSRLQSVQVRLPGCPADAQKDFRPFRNSNRSSE